MANEFWFLTSDLLARAAITGCAGQLELNEARPLHSPLPSVSWT